MVIYQVVYLYMVLTEKRSGKIKARACANGSTQRDHIAKEEATAPTGFLKPIS